MSLEKEVSLASDLQIPRIITGLWQIADMERKDMDLHPKETAQHMVPYVENGLYAFDMADHYGSSELIAGEFKGHFEQGKSTKLFTKWVPQPGKITMQDVEVAVDLSYNRLKENSIDLLQFHAWQYADPSWIDGLKYLQQTRRSGKFKHLGVTNFDHIHLKMALDCGIHIVSNQICHSLLDRRAEAKMKEVCLAYGCKILAFGTLAGGFLTDKWLGKKEPKIEELETWSEMKYKRFIDAAGGWNLFQNLLNAVKKVSDKHSVSMANIASRFVLENEAVAAIIIGARLGQRNHIEDNLKILEIDLDQEDIEHIKEAQSRLSPIPGNCGDEYRKPPFLTASGDLSHHLETFPKVYEVVEDGSDHARIFSGTPWEEFAGYCRAVKSGNRIHVSGTTATHGAHLIGGDDAASQTHFVIDKIEGVLLSFGSSLEDVVRTRIFVKRIQDWEAVARAHGSRFNGIYPANTLVQADLVGDEYLVEIEAEAVIRN